MQHPASRSASPSLIPGLFKRTIIRPALLFILLLFSSFSALAYDCEVDGIYYDLNTTDNIARVTYRWDNVNCYGGKVVIPESITYCGTSYSVTSIGLGAFRGCYGLSSVTIPNSVTSIGSSAFSGCTAMTKLIITAPIPPTCCSRALDDINKRTCELFVNKESINQYKAAEQWKEYVFISEYDGVDDVSDLSVETPDALYEVYNLQGVRVGSGMRETEVTADVLPHGVYILVSPQSRKKLKI